MPQNNHFDVNEIPHFGHSLGPARRSPHVDNGLRHVLVRAVGKLRLRGPQALGRAEGKSATTRGVLRAPVRDRGVVCEEEQGACESQGKEIGGGLRVLRSHAAKHRLTNVARAANADHVLLETKIGKVAPQRRVILLNVLLLALLGKVGRLPVDVVARDAVVGYGRFYGVG